MIRKFGVALLGLVVLAAALSVVSHIRVKASQSASAERLSAALERAVFSPVELREDIDELRTWLRDVHPAEIPSFPLGDIEAALQEAEDGIHSSLDHLGFYRRIAPVVNGLGDEHTMVFPPDSSDPMPGFPFEVRIIDNRIFAWLAHHGDTGIAHGDELLSINGVPAAAIIDSMSAYYSGTTAKQKQQYAEWNFASALPQVLDIRPPFELEIRRVGTDRATTEQVPAVDRSGSLWPAFSAFSYEETEPNVMRFTFNAFEDEDNRFDEFLENIFGDIQERDIESLIIDLRRNQGGASEYGDRVLDYLTDRPFTQLKSVDVTVSEFVKQEFLGYVPAFLRWLPIEYLHPFLRPLWTGDVGDVVGIDFEPVPPSENPLRFRGEVFVLIGPGTMSSASLFAAAIKHYGLGTLVGEETGGFATMYGNIVDARLPNTGLKVWMPTSVVNGHGEGPVIPDYEVRDTASDVAASRDAVVDFTLKLAREKQNEN